MLILAEMNNEAIMEEEGELNQAVHTHIRLHTVVVIVLILYISNDIIFLIVHH
jgi:hypothetical protein